MRFVHSLWNKPAYEDTYSSLIKYINPYLFALSCCYLKRLGQKVVLYTDSIGKELLKHAPYDEIHVEFDSLNNVNTKFFAYPKFISYSHEGNESIHLDGDIMIKNNIVLYIINQTKNIITYAREEGIGTTEGNQHTLDFFENILHKNEPILLQHRGKEWYNCGLLQIKDKKLFDEYVAGYFHYYDIFKDIILPTEEFDCLCPDLVIEQQWLYDLAKTRNAHHISLWHTLYPRPVYTDTFMVHYIGWGKYTLATKFLKTFKEIFPKVYNDTNAVMKEHGLLLDEEEYRKWESLDYVRNNQVYLKSIYQGDM